MPNAQAGCQSEYRAARRDIVLGHQIERSPDLGAVTPQLILDHVLGGEHETLVIGVDVERRQLVARREFRSCASGVAPGSPAHRNTALPSDLSPLEKIVSA